MNDIYVMDINSMNGQGDHIISTRLWPPRETCFVNDILLPRVEEFLHANLSIGREEDIFNGETNTLHFNFRKIKNQIRSP